MSKINEKQIHKKSLTEVVNYLNRENKTLEDANDEEVYSKKNIRLLNKKSNKKIKIEPKIENISQCKVEDKKVVEDKKIEISTSEKLTRKERRNFKRQNKGEGISSKEYMKVFKEGPGRKIEKEEKIRSRLHMPSKSKLEYPKTEEKPKIRNKFKPKKNHRK